MLLIRPNYLRVRSPSPTTVEFIVSNAFSTNTIASQVLFYLSILFRILGGGIALFLLIANALFHLHSTRQDNPGILDYALISASVLDPVTSIVPWQVLVPCSLSVLFLCFHRFHTGESPNCSSTASTFERRGFETISGC